MGERAHPNPSASCFLQGTGKVDVDGSLFSKYICWSRKTFTRIQHFLVGLRRRPGALYLHDYSFHAGLQAEVTQVEYSDWPRPGRPLCRNN